MPPVCYLMNQNKMQSQPLRLFVQEVYLLGFQMTRILEYNSTKNMKDQKHFFSCPEAVIGSVVQRSDILCVTGLNIHLINYREPFLELKNQTWDNLYHHWNKLKLYL